MERLARLSISNLRKDKAMIYVFTFRLWDTTDVEIESMLLSWAMDEARRQDIYLEDIESITVREKKYG
jgi:hypothetical protein